MSAFQREDVRAKRWPLMPSAKYFVPNGLTAISLLLGLASVAMAAQGAFVLAAWMILWATLLDKLDGTTARLLNARSEFGVQFDSFADFVSFGIAPAGLIYFRLLATGAYSSGAAKLVLMAAAGLYPLALGIRLARFNISEPPLGAGWFYGIPGTLLGACAAAAYLTWDKYQLSEALLGYCPIVLLVGAVLMVSNLRIAKLKLRKNKAFNAFQLANVAFAYICGPLRLFPEYLFGLAASYLTVGILWCLVFPPRMAESTSERESSEQSA